MKLGDWVADLLHRLGIRQREGCGCPKRQMWLNRLGDRLRELWPW